MKLQYTMPSPLKLQYELLGPRRGEITSVQYFGLYSLHLNTTENKGL
jgi:hypothetical protein